MVTIIFILSINLFRPILNLICTYYTTFHSKSQGKNEYCDNMSHPMLKYQGKRYSHLIDIYYGMVREDLEFNEAVFPRWPILNVKYHLEDKFKRRFTIKEIGIIIRDKSWQTKSASQIKEDLDNINKKLVDQNVSQ